MIIDRRIMNAYREDSNLVRDIIEAAEHDSVPDREEVKQLIRNEGKSSKPCWPAILTTYTFAP